MEHIREVLGKLDRGTPTQNQKIPELTLEEKREALRKSLGVSSLENTFANFKSVKGTEKALKAFKELSQGSKWQMLLCYGGVGNGKTHLCEALSIELYKRGIFCRVGVMSKMMRTLKKGMNPEPLRQYSDILDGLCTCSHLIIDDVGMGGSGSEWEYGQLEEIVASRYREGLFTVLTTNRDITELPERITSRFRDKQVGRICLNEAPDYRTRKMPS